MECCIRLKVKVHHLELSVLSGRWDKSCRSVKFMIDSQQLADLLHATTSGVGRVVNIFMRPAMFSWYMALDEAFMILVITSIIKYSSNRL